MLDNELLGLLKIMSKVLDQQQMGRKFDLQIKETSGTPERRTNKISTSNTGSNNNYINMQVYFISNANREADKKANRLLTMKVDSDFSDNLTGTSCFEGTFKLKVIGGSYSYQAPLRRVAYLLQELLQVELDRLQKQQIIIPLDFDETSEWCNSFMLVPKANGKVKLCLHPAQLNKALIRPIDKGPTLNNILPWLAGFKYFMLINESSGYQNLKIR